MADVRLVQGIRMRVGRHFYDVCIIEKQKNIAARAAFVLKCLIYNLLRAAMFM